jgi:sigma-B regulation protein RsbU (phosphoserine phosphatase)
MNTSRDDPDLYELAACGLLTLGSSGAIERANRTACTWLETEPSQLVGRLFSDLLTIGGKLFHQTHWLPLLQMQGSVAEVQLELALAGGRTLPVLVNAVRRADGRVDVALFVASDRRKYERELLAARRRAEELFEQLRTIAANSPDVIVRFDRDRRCSYASPAIEALSGRPADESIGKSVREIALSEAAREAFASAIEEALAGSSVTRDFEYVRADGKRLELETRFVGEREPGGAVVSVLTLTRDVTAAKEQAREAEQRAVLAEQLIGIVSHDLRNPLNAIGLGAQLLSSSDLGQSSRVVRRIVSAADRATRLTSDLLDFTQARLGGGLPVTRGEVDLHTLVAECLEELRLAWPGRAIEHRRVRDGKVSADGDRLAQVVTNLVGNAITYGATDVAITVTSAVDDDAFAIAVHNAGRPIPEAIQPVIFEPLRRGMEQVQRGSRSVGLGLYIVNQIARAHGGRVTLRSTEDEGTTFRVEIPR